MPESLAGEILSQLDITRGNQRAAYLHENGMGFADRPRRLALHGGRWGFRGGMTLQPPNLLDQRVRAIAAPIFFGGGSALRGEGANFGAHAAKGCANCLDVIRGIRSEARLPFVRFLGEPASSGNKQRNSQTDTFPQHARGFALIRPRVIGGNHAIGRPKKVEIGIALQSAGAKVQVLVSGAQRAKRVVRPQCLSAADSRIHMDEKAPVRMLSAKPIGESRQQADTFVDLHVACVEQGREPAAGLRRRTRLWAKRDRIGGDWFALQDGIFARNLPATAEEKDLRPSLGGAAKSQAVEQRSERIDDLL